MGQDPQQYVQLQDPKDRAHVRDVVAFWICGLINNYAYVVMLSAADDLLHDSGYDMPVSVVLLADILPCFLIQFAAPWVMAAIPYWVRIVVVTVLSVSSFIIPAFFQSVFLKLIGPVCASLASGLGEITLLALTSHYHKNTVSAFSSGTGGAGIAGSFSYLGLSILIQSPKTRLIASCFLPLITLPCYFFLMTTPATLRRHRGFGRPPSDDDESDAESASMDEVRVPLTLAEKLALLKRLAIPFMLPLATVYFMEYVVNQSIDPVLLYPGSAPTKLAQEYVFYQAIYQVGVFISRSSVNLAPIRKDLLFLPAVFQTINMVLLSLVAVFNFIPTIYIIFVIILWEGLLGGCIYVNTFWAISSTFVGRDKEFCLGATSMSYSLSITFAALVGIGWQPMLEHGRARFG